MPDRAAVQRFTRRAVLAAGFAGVGVLLACQTAPPTPAAPTPSPVPPSPMSTAAPAAPTGIPSRIPVSPTLVAISTAAVAAGPPRRGGTFVAAAEQDPGDLDPHLSAGPGSLLADDLVYESLTAFDEKMAVVPALARSWDVSPDGKTYTFHLRPGVTFHDGKALTAEDVKYSLGRVLDPKASAPFRSWLGPLKDVQAADPASVRLVLDAPYAGLLGGLAALRGSAIVPAGAAEKQDLHKTAVGTGPFRLTEYVAGDHLTYVRHASYWDQPLPYLDGITFKILADEKARVTAMGSGQVGYALVTVQAADELQRVGGIRVLGAPVGLLDLTVVNVGAPLLGDARVRRGLRLATDTQQVIRTEAEGAGVPTGPVPTGFADWFVDPAKLPYLAADVDGAKKLIADAGFPEGKGLALTVKATPQLPTTEVRATLMQTALRKIGVDLQVQRLQLNDWIQAYQTGDFDLLNAGYTFSPDPDGYVYPYYHSNGRLNAGGYGTPSLDRLIDQARAESDHAQRRGLYQEIQKTLLDDCPSFWWYAQVNLEALSARVQGYVQSFTGRRVFLKQAWLA